MKKLFFLFFLHCPLTYAIIPAFEIFLQPDLFKIKPKIFYIVRKDYLYEPGEKKPSKQITINLADTYNKYIDNLKTILKSKKSHLEEIKAKSEFLVMQEINMRLQTLIFISEPAKKYPSQETTTIKNVAYYDYDLPKTIELKLMNNLEEYIKTVIPDDFLNKFDLIKSTWTFPTEWYYNEKTLMSANIYLNYVQLLGLYILLSNQTDLFVAEDEKSLDQKELMKLVVERQNKVLTSLEKDIENLNVPDKSILQPILSQVNRELLKSKLLLKKSPPIGITSEESFRDLAIFSAILEKLNYRHQELVKLPMST